ncbi:MAG: hypothetical protein RL033_1394 [Pseudomonadota bacterium]
MNQNTETLPLTGAQRALLLEVTTESAGEPAESYRVTVVEASGELDVARLERSLHSVAGRHDVFRSSFVHVPGHTMLRQVFAREPAAALVTAIDLTGEVAIEDVLQRSARALATAPLDAGRPLLRAELFRTRLLSSEPSGSPGEDARASFLVLAVPRLMADRRGLELFCCAVLEEYHGRPAAAASDTSYEQFARWCEDLELGEEGASGAAYWREYVAGIPGAPLRVPGRRSAPVTATHDARWGSVGQGVSPQLSDALRALAEREQVPLQVVVQAGWWALIARIAGQEELVGGWLHDCRDDYDAIAETVGVFERLFPVRVRVLPRESFLQWLTRFATTTGQHRDWQESWPVAEADRAGLARVGFAVERADLPAVVSRAELPQFDLRRPLVLRGCELVASAVLTVEGALQQLRIRHSSACYDGNVAARLVGQLAQLLAGVAADPFAPLLDLPVVDEEERRALLAPNDAPLTVEAVTLPQRVSEWAARTPEAPALQSGAERLSYAELQHQVIQLADWFIEQGVQPEDRVALLLPRSAAMIVAMLAVQRAGAAYIPLEPRAPWGRTRRVLEDAQPRLVLSEREWLAEREPEELHALGLRWVTREDLEAELTARSSPRPAPDLTPNGAAYVMYTSGSTGQPKGVLIEHGQLANYAAAVSQELGLASCRRFAIVSTMAADLGHTALYGGLFNGGCLVIASDEDMSDGQNFARFLREGEVDCLKIVPSHLEALLVSETRRLPRTLVLGGESTPLDLVARIFAIEPGCRLFNHYGPTETTVGVLVHPVRSLEEERSHTLTGTLPLTRVLPGCRVYLLDAAQRLVPTGQLGELYVGGAQVCRGYVNGGQEQRFVPDPLRPGERLYRTGDLGRYRAHGGIDLMGRADDQVKISGYRIEPGEVEAVLRALPGVLAGAVLVQQTTAGPRLVAYAAVDDPESPTGEQRLLDALRQSLPDPMVPREVVLLAQLPRLPNGKLDRQSLPRAVRRSAGTARPAGEVSALEAGILSCMARVLGREDLGAVDSFFDFGGNSLLAIKLVSRLRERFHIEVPLNAVFDHPSAEKLGPVLEQLGGRAE